MKSPSGWVNLQDYLGVNQDQAGNMANRVGANVGKQSMTASDRLRDANSAFRTRSQVSNSGDPAQANNSADAYNRAKAAYGGPSQLSDVDQGLQSSIADAQARLSGVQSGQNQQTELSGIYGNKMAKGGLDSFLTTAAGNQQGGAFQKLQSQYGGLGKDYQADLSSSQDIAQSNAKQQDANRAGWEKRGNQLKVGEDEAAAAAQKRIDDRKIDEDFAKAQKMSTLDRINRGFNDMNKVLSPITQVSEALGYKDPIQNYGTKLIHGDEAKASGSTNGQHIDWHKSDRAVYAQMDAAQWKELNDLAPHAQRTWIERRAEELKNGGKHTTWDAGRASRETSAAGTGPFAGGAGPFNWNGDDDQRF